ncbi:MAG: efflux RND transporter periplasmic adaptor subunit, partial [bacterium]
SACAQLNNSQPLETTEVALEQAPTQRLFDGTVEAINQSTVSAQTSGRIAEIFYDVDDHVEAGSPIIRFTDVEQQSALRQAQALLKEARARKNEADEEFRRASDLLKKGSGTKREYDRALAGREAAGARMASAQSAVRTAQQQVDYTTVTAPYPGIVTKRHVELGEFVAVGQPLMSGLSLELLRITVDLPQQIATKVRKHMRAEVIAEDGRISPTQITIFPFADPATNTFKVRLDLPEGQFDLYPGMFVKVAFILGKSQKLLIPTTALVRRSEVKGVYVVDNDQIRLRQIRIGNRFGDHTEVLSGLSPGERIALDPVKAGIKAKSIPALSNAQ